MAHLIEAIHNASIEDVVGQLESAHAFVVQRALEAQQDLLRETSSWGAFTKRLTVDLSHGHEGVGKSSEKLVEVINILATTERTISALSWFLRHFPQAIVRECHPSTSDDAEGNDIVLVDDEGSVLVRCEVCDVVSNKAGQNGKEVNDLKNLGCADHVPRDGVRRFIATSPEFACALSSESRKWAGKRYRYKIHDVGSEDNTIMLELEGVLA